MRTSAVMESYARTIRVMLGTPEPVPPAPDLWDTVVGIPLDEWIQADTVFKLRLAKLRRAYRRARR